MLFSELENYTLYQAELNVITINENHEIFEVPGQNENSRLQTYLAIYFMTFSFSVQTVVSVHIAKPIAWRSLYGQYTIDDFR
jgi:hypothetical protein